MNAANRRYRQGNTVCFTLLLTLVWCDASSLVRLEHLGWVPPKPDSRNRRQVLEHSRHRPVCTHKEQPKKLFSVRACQHDWGPPRLWLMTGVLRFWSLTRVGSVGWESSPLYLVNIILIISLTNPASWAHVCVCICAYTGRGFSMPSVVQVCIMKSWVLFLKPSEFQPFSHLRFFSRLPSSPLPSHPRVLPRNSPPKVTECEALSKSKINTGCKRWGTPTILTTLWPEGENGT